MAGCSNSRPLRIVLNAAATALACLRACWPPTVAPSYAATRLYNCGRSNHSPGPGPQDSRAKSGGSRRLVTVGLHIAAFTSQSARKTHQEDRDTPSSRYRWPRTRDVHHRLTPRFAMHAESPCRGLEARGAQRSLTAAEPVEDPKFACVAPYCVDAGRNIRDGGNRPVAKSELGGELRHTVIIVGPDGPDVGEGLNAGQSRLSVRRASPDCGEMTQDSQTWPAGAAEAPGVAGAISSRSDSSKSTGGEGSFSAIETAGPVRRSLVCNGFDLESA
jgi:hypothetical protein